MPANLEPRPLAADVKQATVRKQPPQVSGAVHAQARAAGTRKKHCRRLLRVLPVAHGERAREDGDLPLASCGCPASSSRTTSVPSTAWPSGDAPGQGVSWLANHCRITCISVAPRPTWNTQRRGKRLRYRSKSEASTASPPSFTTRSAERSSRPSSVHEKQRKTLGTEWRIVMRSRVRNSGSRRSPSPASA